MWPGRSRALLRHATFLVSPPPSVRWRMLGGNTKTAARPAGSSREQLDDSLAFVNRYAETLDVLFPNLSNQEALRLDDDTKRMAPLAAQPPGTGKTALGRNLIAVLQRPREEAGLEAEVARRLMNAWAWRGSAHGARSAIAEAIADPRDENLVMRTLRVCFPHHAGTLERLKESKAIVVPMKELPRPGSMLDFDDALGVLIYTAATGTKNVNAYIKFIENANLLRGSDDVVEALIRERGPLLLVLDDITDLALSQFEPYFRNGKPTPLHNAMTELSLCLQRLHGVKDCFVFCTGRLPWLSVQALVGATSPLLVTPLMLSPLSAGDVLETLSLTQGSSKASTLASEVGVTPEMLPYLAKQAVRATGGMGRVLQFLLRELQRESAGRPPASTHAAIDAALERAHCRLAAVAGIVLRVSWDGPANTLPDVPDSLRQQAPQRKLLLLFIRALLLDAPFDPSLDVILGPDSLAKFSDAAVVFGLSYAPFTSPPHALQRAGDGDSDGSSDVGIVSAAPTGAAAPPTLLKLVAGDWLCRSLVTAQPFASDAFVLPSSMLLETMRKFGGTMCGRPFELLCIDALCTRSLLSPDVPLSLLVPHLSVTAALRSLSVPRLRVVAMPKVTHSKTVGLDAAERASLLRDQNCWPGDRPTLSPVDLTWLLTVWLPPGTIAVPADALGGAQDWFLRLGYGIAGFANKAVGELNGTAWEDLQEELAKAPTLPIPFRYTLVLLSLNLAPELREAVGNAEACVFGSGAWFREGGRLTQAVPRPGAVAVFCVPERVELVLVNPNAPNGGGLADLLGQRVLASLHSLAAGSSTEPLSVSSLTAWTPAEH